MFPLFATQLSMFGIMVAAGIGLGLLLIFSTAKKQGLDDDMVVNMIIFALPGGFFLAHVFNDVFYYPQKVLKDPMSLLYVTEGLSSYGGMIGGLFVMFLFLKWNKARFLPHSDIMIVGFALAMIFGRLGCALAFDHPGYPTTFFLGMKDSEGIIRHNLGLYECLVFIPIFITLYLVHRKPQPEGMITGLFAVIYAPIRFLLDFLRIPPSSTELGIMGDVRYFGLTPAQYASIMALVLGVFILRYAFRVNKPKGRMLPSDDMGLMVPRAQKEDENDSIETEELE